MSSGIAAAAAVAVIACAGAANDAWPTIEAASMQSATTKRMRAFEDTHDLCTGAYAGQFGNLTGHLRFLNVCFFVAAARKQTDRKQQAPDERSPDSNAEAPSLLLAK